MSWNEEAETTQFKVLLLHHHMNEYGLKGINDKYRRNRD